MSAFVAVQILRSEHAAMCPQCRTPRYVFHRLSRGTICGVCAEKPLPRADASAVEHPTWQMGLVFRHGKPVLCMACERPRTVFSLASGLCILCHK
jgi:ribosomal protein S27E